MAQVVVGLIGPQAIDLVRNLSVELPFSQPAPETADLELWESHIEETIEEAVDLSETDRESLIVARRGRGSLSSV